MLAAMRRASSRVSRCAAERRPARPRNTQEAPVDELLLRERERQSPGSSLCRGMLTSSRPWFLLGLPVARDWLTELLRLSAFSAEAIVLSDEDWTILTDQDEAETRQLIPGGGKRYIGRLGSGQFILSALGTRLDIFLNRNPGVATSESIDFPSIGDWGETCNLFVAHTSRWLTKTSLPIARIAFAPVLLSETRSVVESYEVLKVLLKSVSVVPEEMRDLIYRVNWPQESKVAQGLCLNRITNWSALQASALLIQVGGVASTAASSPAEKFAVRLEMDHNTDQENKQPFEKRVLLSIYDELVEFARKNAERGERP
jgi:hypothetical protein